MRGSSVRVGEVRVGSSVRVWVVSMGCEGVGGEYMGVRGS